MRNMSMTEPQTNRTNSSSICRARLFYHGELGRDGRLVRIPCTSTEEVEETLGQWFDARFFEPFYRRGDTEAFRRLRPADLCGGCEDSVREAKHNEAIDICLFPRTAASSGGDSAHNPSVQCDSASAGLTGRFWGIGIYRGKSVANHGSVWRTALQFGAAYAFTVGEAYSRKVEGGADVYKTHRQIPFISYPNIDSFRNAAPMGVELVAIEYGGADLVSFNHPGRALYILGAEVEGLPGEVLRMCSHHISIPTAHGRPDSLNVAAAAAIVMYDRFCKAQEERPS